MILSADVNIAISLGMTLTFENGSIQVAGRELDQGTSTVSIVGGSGKYSGITGEMKSTNNNNGTFTQKLYYSIKR